VTPIDGLIQHKLGVMDDDVTSGLLADVTMMMVTLAAGHRQMALPGYRMMSRDNASHPGY